MSASLEKARELDEKNQKTPMRNEFSARDEQW
jgi:hypothetical protein